jgi:hypothetical protein
VAPTLTYLANYFNQWSYWVSTDILIAGSLNAQVQAVKKFISVLHHLFSLNNFNSLMAVMSGLNRASVSRYKLVSSRACIWPTDPQLSVIAMQAQESVGESSYQVR